MNNRQFDLNLIRVFCTIFETGNQTKSAEILEISQPAISHALKKLRLYYDDPLFVRSEGKMIPTPLAKSIMPNLKKSVELINVSLQSHALFGDNMDIKKKFIFSMSDMSQMFFLPPICLLIEDVLDQLDIEILQVSQDKIERLMRIGELDFALGNLPDIHGLKGKIAYEHLFDDRFVCMVRDGHPLSDRKNKTLDMERLKLIGINSKVTGHRGIIEGINKAFSDNIVLKIPNYTVAPEIVSKTDFGVIIPISIARRFNIDQQFDFYELDLPGNKIEINIYYHELYNQDHSILKMKNLIIDNFREI